MHIKIILIAFLYKLNLIVTNPSDDVKILGFFPHPSASVRWINQSRSMFRIAFRLCEQLNLTFNGKSLIGEEILTDDEIILTFNSTCDQVSNSNVIGFVGPAYSNEVRYLSSFAYRLGIPVVSYSATSPDLSTIDNRSFYRISPSDENLVLAFKVLFEQTKWKSCLIIYENDEFGYNGMQLLSQQLTQIKIQIFQMIKFDRYQRTFQIDFEKSLRSSLSRIVIVWANEISTIEILQKALESNFLGEDFVWILTTRIPIEYFNSTEQDKLIGLLTIESFQSNSNQILLNELYQLWKTYEIESCPSTIDEISIYALYTFDATWSLILSLKQLCSNQSSCFEFVNVSHCSHRQFNHSKQYYEIIRRLSFSGVSGQIEFNSTTPNRATETNYLMKNIQRTNGIDYVSVLQWNSNQTQWINLKNQSNTIFWTKHSTRIPRDHKSIRGQQLRIAIIESPPSIILKDSFQIYQNMKNNNYETIEMNQFDGFYKDFLLYLQDKMSFDPVIMLAKPTIRYDDLVEGVANDTFDLVLSSIDINAKRNQIVDFSIAILPASYRIVIRKPNSIQTDYLLPLKPFLWTFWLFLMILIPYTNILIWIVEPQTESEKNCSFIGIFLVISYPIYNPFGQSHPQVKTKIGHFLTKISSILQLFLLAVHTAGLISMIVTNNSPLILSGIDDIKNGRIPSNRIGILVGSQIEEYYLNSISQGKKDYFPLKTPDEVYTRLIQRDIDASLWSNISTAFHIQNLYCDLTTVGLGFSHSFYQIPVKHGWLYTAELNFNILSFLESGQIDRISTKWFQRNNCSRTIHQFAHQTKTVAITTVTRLFLTFALVSFLSLFFHFWPKREHQQQTTTNSSSSSSSFIVIDLSTRLNQRASAMLNVLSSSNKDLIEIHSTFDLPHQLQSQTNFLFTSSQFAQSIQNQSKQFEKIFILEEDKHKVNNRLTFGTGEDLIYQLSDEIYRFYQQQAQLALQSNDLIKAQFNEQQAKQIYQQLKQVHQQFANSQTTKSNSTTRIIWLKTKNEQIEKVKDLLCPFVCSFSIFDKLCECEQYLSEVSNDDHLFVIGDIQWQKSIFNQFQNVKFISNENDLLTICLKLKIDLIHHFNKLGMDLSSKKEHQIAKQMFIKAQQLCHFQFS